MIACILHFDDAPDEKGCLRVYPGSHKLGPLPAEGDDHHVSDKIYPIGKALPIPAEAGDAIFFHYLLVHGSGVNVSDEPRTTLLVQLRDPEDVPLNQGHASRGQGMMLAGVDPSRTPFKFAWEEKAA
jgi:ectoine hydroxylase-related dioxygenase (phytanoyl-CoA dioxygenase family)